MRIIKKKLLTDRNGEEVRLFEEIENKVFNQLGAFDGYPSYPWHIEDEFTSQLPFQDGHPYRKMFND